MRYAVYRLSRAQKNLEVIPGVFVEADNEATALSMGFDEQLLPAIMTSLRQRIHSVFDIWLYTKPMGFGPARKYYVTAQADSVRPAKHSVNFRTGTNLAMIPNDLKSLLALMEPAAAATAPVAPATK